MRGAFASHRVLCRRLTVVLCRVQRRRGGDVSPADVDDVRSHLAVLVALIRQHANFAVKQMGLQELHKLLAQHPKGM